MAQKKSEFAYQWAINYIEEHRFSNNMKMPSENSVCQLLNISRETVRIAYDRLEAEGLITRQRGSGTYIQQDRAISRDLISDNASTRVALIIHGRQLFPYEQMIKGIHYIFDQENISLQIYITDNHFYNERKFLKSLSLQDFSGFIIDGVKSSYMTPNLDCYLNMYHRNIPIIFYNNYYRDVPYPKVTMDNTRAADGLMKQLYQAHHRHYIGIFVYDNIQSIEKFQSIFSYMNHHNMELPDENLLWLNSDEVFHKTVLREIEHFLRQHKSCTAIVCGNSRIYEYVQEVIGKMNLQIPGDFSVVCFDYPEQKLEATSVTCTVHRGYDLGIHIAVQLKEMLHSHSINEKQYSYQMAPLFYSGTSIQPLS